MGKIVNSSLLLMASYQDFIPNQLSKSFNTWITSSLKSWKLSMKIAWRTWSSSSCRSMQLSSISNALNILYSREFYYIQSPQSPMVEVAPRIFLWLRAFVIVKESKQKLTMVVDLTISRRLLVPILSIKMQFYDKAGKLRHSTFTNENR